MWVRVCLILVWSCQAQARAAPRFFLDHFCRRSAVVDRLCSRISRTSGQGGRHLRFPHKTPLTNLLLALLDKVGVPADHLGDSTGALSL